MVGYKLCGGYDRCEIDTHVDNVTTRRRRRRRGAELSVSLRLLLLGSSFFQFSNSTSHRSTTRIVRLYMCGKWLLDLATLRSRYVRYDSMMTSLDTDASGNPFLLYLVLAQEHLRNHANLLTSEAPCQ